MVKAGLLRAEIPPRRCLDNPLANYLCEPILEVSGGARIIAGHAQRLAKKGHDALIVAPRPAHFTFKEKAKALLGIGDRQFGPDQSLVALAGVPLHMANRRSVPDRIIPRAGRRRDHRDVVGDSRVDLATRAAKGAKADHIQHYETFQNVPAERVDAVWRLPIAKIAVAQWLIDLGRSGSGSSRRSRYPTASITICSMRARGAEESRRRSVSFSRGALQGCRDQPQGHRAGQEARPDVRFLSFGAVMPAAADSRPDCEFHYRPTQAQIADIYGRCDAWLSTSRTEGFNLPPLEAMANGCPAVRLKTGRPLEILKDGVNGFLVDAGDDEGFADATLRILSLSETDWRSMSAAANRSVAIPLGIINQLVRTSIDPRGLSLFLVAAHRQC